MSKFKIGDRAVVNDLVDPLIPSELRNQMLGARGQISALVPEDNSLVFFKPDTPKTDYPTTDWALIDHELDKLDD